MPNSRLARMMEQAKLWMYWLDFWKAEIPPHIPTGRNPAA